MDRADYLKLCQRVAVLPKTAPPDLCVKYNEIAYLPVGYKLTFDKEGNAIHTAILRDLNQSNSIINCDLSKIERMSNE
jgi:hypothetical protein